MKGVDLSNYALEDLLAFDDIFLDYFNNFLKNPAFPQPIQYNRYQSFFEEIDQIPDAIIHLDKLPKQVTHKLAKTLNLSPSPRAENDDDSPNLNEIEQQKVFDWVRKERLPLFFRTDFFREFKLCRLLTRSLEEEDDTSQASSQMIGGYSRQTSVSNTLSTEEHEGRMSQVAGLFYNSASKRMNDRTTDTESRLFKSNNIDVNLLDKFNKVLFQRPGSRALSVPSYFPFKSTMFSTNQTNLFLKENDEPSTKLKSGHLRIESNTGKLNKLKSRSSRKQEKNSDDHVSIKNSIHDFKSYMGNSENTDNGKTGSEQKPSDMFYNDITKSLDEEDFPDESHSHSTRKKLETTESQSDQEFIMLNNKNETNQSVKLDDNISFIEDDYEGFEDFVENEGLHASINQYKLKFLGSVRGMTEFKEFLKGTFGHKLIKFWLDCEFYRDSMQDYDQIENMATRNRLFRDINEKYVFAFSEKMHQKISQNYLDSSSLNHTIFDQIQYDVLRRIRAYWVPRFILSKLKSTGKDYGYSFPLPAITPVFSRQSTYISARSAKNCKRELPLINEKPSSQEDVDENGLFYEKVKQALYADKAAGGPFLRYISGNNSDNLPLILFWYDVCDFYEVESIGFDKNSRIQHAWAIYNSYLSPTARFNIGLPHDVAEEARKSLQIISNSSTYNSIIAIDKKLFQPVMEQIIPYLQNSWVKFIKDDVFKYTQYKYEFFRSRLAALLVKREEEREGDVDGDNEEEKEIQELFDKIPEPDMVVEGQTIFLKRPWIQNFLNMSTQVPVKKELSEEEKLERIERIRIMEIERKKALKKVMKRNNLVKKNLKDRERVR